MTDHGNLLKKFDCGVDDLNELASKAEKWSGQDRMRAFAAHHDDLPMAAGFYTLSMRRESAKKFGGQVAQIFDSSGAPLIYIDGLAVRKSYQGQGLGRLLLIDALRRSHHIWQHLGIYGVGLRSLNERTTRFYEAHGFGAVEQDERHPLLVVPIWTLRDLFEGRSESSATDPQKPD